MKSMGGARKLHRKWNETEKEDKIDILCSAGKMLERKSDYDSPIALSGGFPIKYLAKARSEISQYLKSAEELIKEYPGMGPVFAATSVTTPHVQPYVMVEALLGNCSITIKGDKDEPFSAYLLSEIGQELELPIQFITYDSKEKSRFAHEMYKNLCVDAGGHFVLMGDPKTPLKIAYPEILEKIGNDETLLSELQIPKGMITYTDHGGIIYIHKSADIKSAVRGTLESYQFPMACKTPVEILVDHEVMEEYRSILLDNIKKLKVGPVTDTETDIAELNSTQWEALVDPFLRTAKGNGKIIYGGDKNQPAVIVGFFEDNCVMEPHWPTLCLESVESYAEAVEKINHHGINHSRKSYLDLSIFYKDLLVGSYFESMRRKNLLAVHTIHDNLPTLTVNPNIGHENTILRDVFSGKPYFDRIN